MKIHFITAMNETLVGKLEDKAKIVEKFHSNAEDNYECKMLMLRERASSSRHRLRCRRTSGVQLRAQTFLPEKEQTGMRNFVK